MDSQDEIDSKGQNGEQVERLPEKPMGFLEHLEDLRWTVVKCATVFVFFAVLIGFGIQRFNQVLLWPLTQLQKVYPELSIELGTTSVMEGFSVVIQMCCVGGLVLASPFMLFFIGQFVAPALTPKEKRLVIPTVIASALLFIVGASFSFFLLVPSTLRVSVELNQLLNLVTRWTPDSYYSMLMWLVMGVGASFEFPLLIVLAVYMRLITVATLRKFRRHAVVGIFLIAAVVTPTPDPVNMMIFATPLYMLYEVAIIVGARIQIRRAAILE